MTIITANEATLNPWMSLEEMQEAVSRVLVNIQAQYIDVPRRSLAQKAARKAGRISGKTKNFFSKTETKVGTLIAYWAADSMVAVLLILTTTNVIALTFAASMLVLHTYATFSVAAEVTK